MPGSEGVKPPEKLSMNITNGEKMTVDFLLYSRPYAALGKDEAHPGTVNVWIIILLLNMIFFAPGCALFNSKKNDPFYESFYEKARLIMTDEEIKIYEFLEDKESKEEFIREFWKIRDPNPSTEENEAKTEFEERVRYASRWFSWTSARSYREDYEPTKAERGWDSDMGRIYIVLGPPDIIVLEGREVVFEGNFDRRRLSGSRSAETWYYYTYRLTLNFYGFNLDWQSATGPDLHLALETAKLNWLGSGYQGDLQHSLKFKTKYKADKIVIQIPPTRLSFKEEDGKLYAKFKINITVYRDHKKVDTLKEEKTIEETEESLMKKDELRLEIPYVLSDKGAYVFDILMQDLSSTVAYKYRDLLKIRR